MPTNDKITPTMTVREVITKHPSAVKVFNKYGLTGCGGRLGPVEPVGFFASVHQVDPDQLLRELNAIVEENQSDGQVQAEATRPEPDIYRAFVRTAVIIALTVGCGLGAINLAAMAFGRSIGTTWIAITQAHGHAQIFGWVGLFIMGVAYHVLPRLKATELKGKPLAIASFWLVLGGIVLRLAAQPLATNEPFAAVVVLSALLELVGASFFVYVSLATFAAGAQARDFYDKYIMASASWFWVLAASTLAISVYTAFEGTDVIPSSVDGAYLHIGLMGFVAMMIFGFTLRTVPLFLGLKAPNKKAFDLIFWPLNLAVAVKAVGMFAGNVFSDPLAPRIVEVAGAVELVSIISFVYFLNIFRKPEIDIAEAGVDQGYEKYIRTAYAWLLISAIMAFGISIYPALRGEEIGHAYVGAYRHALTVGFISMMILGMASRIIPVFTGTKLYSSTLLLLTFILVNVGNVARVLSQPLAGEFGGIFFVAMGVSGFIEVAGLSLFAYNIWKTMDNKEETLDAYVPEEPATESSAPLPDADAHAKIKLPIAKHHIVGEIIEAYPAALDVFVKHGFDHLKNETLRKTIAKTVTLETVSQIHSIDLDRLLTELNEVCEAADKARRELIA